jgi:hypothetical protein
MGTPEFDKSRDQRKRVEMRFAASTGRNEVT